MIRFSGIQVLALLGSLVTALAYAVTSSGKFEPRIFALPGVLQVAGL